MSSITAYIDTRMHKYMCNVYTLFINYILLFICQLHVLVFENITF